MNKVRFSVSLLLLTLLVFAASFKASAQPKTFMEVYQTALELNRDRFDDLDYILVGDTVLLPSLTGPGVVGWVADERDIVTGRHDCIWIISEKYLAGSLVTIPADTIQVKVPIPIAIDTPEEEKAGFPWWIVLVGIIIILILMLLNFGMVQNLIPLLRNREKAIDEKHPDLYPPVGESLDNASPEEKITTFIGMLEPGEKIISIETGSLIRLHGPKKIYVEMQFGDGINREVYLLPGERISKAVVQQDDHIFDLYARTICANGIVRGKIHIPKGWVFLSDNNVVKITDWNVKEEEDLVTKFVVVDESDKNTSEVDKTKKSVVLPVAKESETRTISANKLNAIADIVGKVVSETETGDIALKMSGFDLKVTFSGKKVKEKEQSIKDKIGKVSEIIN